jgi:hypothetical protein
MANCGSGTSNYSDYYSSFFGNHYATKGYGSSNGSTCAASSVAYQGYPVGADNCCSGGFSAGVGEYDSRCYFAIPRDCPATRSIDENTMQLETDTPLTQTEQDRQLLQQRRRARHHSGETSLDNLYKEVFGIDIADQTGFVDTSYRNGEIISTSQGGAVNTTGAASAEYDCLGNEYTQEAAEAHNRRARQKRQFRK